MAQPISIIKKRSTFVDVRNNGKFVRSKSFNIQILHNNELDDKINIGYTATKRIGNAITRNKAKRRMRELARKVITKYGKKKFYYVIIAKIPILKMPFKTLELELEKILS